MVNYLYPSLKASLTKYVAEPRIIVTPFVHSTRLMPISRGGTYIGGPDFKLVKFTITNTRPGTMRQTQ